MNLSLPRVLWLFFSFSDTSDQLEVFRPQVKPLIVSSEGVTVHNPSLHLVVSCPVDTTYFPFDTQHCLIHAGSWAYSEDLVNISLADPAVYLGTGALGSNKVSNGQWEITSVRATRESVVYKNYDGSYSELKFILTFKRLPTYHLINLAIPIILLHVLSLTTFLVPPEGGERMSVGLTTFLAFSVFTLVLMEQLPESSVSLPIICKYRYLITQFHGLGQLRSTLILACHTRLQNSLPLQPFTWWWHWSRTYWVYCGVCTWYAPGWGLPTTVFTVLLSLCQA